MFIGELNMRYVKNKIMLLVNELGNICSPVEKFANHVFQLGYSI